MITAGSLLSHQLFSDAKWRKTVGVEWDIKRK